MMIKQVQFRGIGESGEIFCQPLHMGLEKTAQAREASSKLHPQVQDFVKAVRPTKHGIYVLVNALGAGEYWGSNVNGDLFPEKALIHAPEGWDKMPIEQQMKVGPTWEWGFPTFLGAYPYKHHSNKDPSRAFGRVELAVWNPKMHRVELVVYLDRALCKKFDAYDVIERIERGEFPDVSMGCKVPYDVCTICENKSKTRHDYCEHASTMMNKILPDGRKVAVRNDNPKFFDISFVFIGADKTAKVMAKLAQKGNQVCLGEYCTLPRHSADVGAIYTTHEIESPQEAFYPLQKTSSCCTEKIAESVRIVDGEKIRNTKNVDFTMGGNHERYPNLVPKGELWIEKDLNPDDKAATLLHEAVETQRMKNGESYNTAHAHANIPERAFRKVLEKDALIPEEFLNKAAMAGKTCPRCEKDQVFYNRGLQTYRCMECHYSTKDPEDLEKTAEKKCPCPRLGQSNCCASKDLTKFAALVFGSPTEKSASHKKVSELIKSIPAGPFTKETLPKLEKTERDIPKDILDLMGGLPLGDALSTPGMMGMVLKPHEFQRIILIRMGDKPLADELDDKDMTFGHTDDIDDSIPVGEEHVDGRLKELLSLLGLVRDRSAATPALHRRSAQVMTKKPKSESRTSEAPVMKKLAAAYNGYRRSLIKKAAVIQQYLTLDPQLRADLFGGSMAQAFAGGIDKVSTASVFGPDSLAYLVGAYTDRDFHLSSKEAVASLALTGAVSETA